MAASHRHQQTTSAGAFACTCGALVGIVLVFHLMEGCSTVRDPAASTEQPAAQVADLAIVNARVWTGRSDPIHGREPTSVALRGERIVAVGDDAAIRPLIGPRTKVIEGGGRRLIPGITDSHTHIVSGGFHLARLNLRDVTNRQEFIDAVAAEARKKAKGQWVVGGRWSVESWPVPESPNRRWLDSVSGATPVFLSRMDGHMALVNSAALTLAGIDAAGPADPKGGEIERDPKTREPTGILKESAMDLVDQLIPPPSDQERYEALRRAIQHANSLGVTSVHDMCSPGDIDAFDRADRAGELNVRVTAYISTDGWDAESERLRSLPAGSEKFQIAGFKGYMDGSLGSRTAYMREPFTDATADTPYPRGQLTELADPPEEFQQLVARTIARGHQTAVHAIGDEANHLLLDAYEYARKQDGARDALPRVEHAQHLHVSDIPRFARLGVVASMQPFHKADDGRYAEKALGRDRLRGSYAFRQLVDAGALLIFGSDWPVVTLSPFVGIDSAVNARTLAGNVWLPEHSLTVEEALRAYTVSPPKAVHRSDRLGTLEPGKFADLVVLSDDPLTMPKEQIGEINADITVMAGRVVFTRSR